MSEESRLRQLEYKRIRWARYKRIAVRVAEEHRRRGSLARVVRQRGAYPGYVVVVKSR